MRTAGIKKRLQRLEFFQGNDISETKYAINWPEKPGVLEYEGEWLTEEEVNKRVGDADLIIYTVVLGQESYGKEKDYGGAALDDAIGLGDAPKSDDVVGDRYP